jgi:hypothetical protein
MLNPEALTADLGIESELSNLIFEIEEKHGYNVHMVIEPIFDSETNEQTSWWVEFENDKRIVETFDDMKKYFLEEVIVTGDGPVVECEDINESDSYEIIGLVDEEDQD